MDYDSRPPPIKPAPWLSQVKWLLWREIIDAKNPQTMDLNTILFMFTAVVLGLWYTKSNERTFPGMQTANGLLFMVTSQIIYTNAYSVMFSFAPTLTVLLREKRLYGPSAYYVSKTISMIPRVVFQTILFATAVHLAGNLGGNDGISTFLSICGVLGLVSVAAASYGCMLSGLSDGPDMAYSIAQPLDLMASSMGGIFGSVHERNVLSVAWLKYFSTFFYSYECTSILYWSSVEYLDCTGAPSGCPTNGGLVLANGDLQPENLGRDLLLLVVYCLVCHLIGFVGIWFRWTRQTVY